MIAILRRYESNGRTYRVLDCPHEHHVAQLGGGKADNATHVRGCQGCLAVANQPKPPPVIGACGAIVLNPKLRRAHPCGAEARYLKRGQPRCASHMRKGAA